MSRAKYLYIAVRSPRPLRVTLTTSQARFGGIATLVLLGVGMSLRFYASRGTLILVRLLAGKTVIEVVRQCCLNTGSGCTDD